MSLPYIFPKSHKKYETHVERRERDQGENVEK